MEWEIILKPQELIVLQSQQVKIILKTYFQIAGWHNIALVVDENGGGNQVSADWFVQNEQDCNII
jgi:hypothetical protein